MLVRWSTGCAGHVQVGKSVRETVVEEVAEELGVDVDPHKDVEFFGKELVVVDNVGGRNEKHFKYWYVLRADNEFLMVLDKDEVADAKFLSMEEVEEMKLEGELFYEQYLNVVKAVLDKNNSNYILEENG